MARPSAIVTDAELSVLNHLWEHGPSVVREIASALYSQNTPAYHATVNSLLDQLEQLRSGKDKVLGFFVGQVMKETGGQANPKVVNEILKRKLEK